MIYPDLVSLAVLAPVLVLVVSSVVAFIGFALTMKEGV
jgi:hypothetical protein